VDYAGTATGDSELIDKVILIGSLQVTITAVASDGSRSPPAGTASGNGLSFHVITMCFRIQRGVSRRTGRCRSKPNRYGSMYDLDVGPKPVDVAPAPLPPAFNPIPFGPAWVRTRFKLLRTTHYFLASGRSTRPGI